MAWCRASIARQTNRATEAHTDAAFLKQRETQPPRALHPHQWSPGLARSVGEGLISEPRLLWSAENSVPKTQLKINKINLRLLLIS